MTNRGWILLLSVFEATWLVYMGLLAPVVITMATHAPEAVVRHSLMNLMFVFPIVLPISALTWAVFIADVARRHVSLKALWILSFFALGVVSLPIYYAVKIRSSAVPSPVV